MQIYLLGTIKDENLKKVGELLTELGHGFYTANGKAANFFDDFKEAEDRILAADAIVGEASAIGEDQKVELALALKQDKPTLIVYSKRDEFTKGLQEIHHKNLKIEKYDDDRELQDIMEEFINQVKDNLDAKLFMIIPPSVNKYLEWVATHTEKTKSDIVRMAVEEVAQKDREYRRFLEKLGK